MGKYIIEIPEDKIADFVGSTHFLMPYMMAGHIGHYDTGLPIKPYTEPDLEQVREEAYEKGHESGFVAGHLKAEKSGQKFYEDGYQRGLADAWETVKELFNFTFDEQATIFKTTSVRDIVRKYSVFEVIEKIRAYEQTQKEQEKIKVGDEVIARSGETIIVAHRLEDDDLGWLDGIGLDGRIPSEDAR